MTGPFFDALRTNIPPHVTSRLLAALGGAEPELIVGKIARDPVDNGRTGEIVVFSRDMVARATLDASGFIEDFEQPDAHSCHVNVWMRRDLVRIALGKDENSDLSWNHADGGWPQEFELHLIYSGGDRATLVRRSGDYPEHAQRIIEFLPSLFDDLRA